MLEEINKTNLVVDVAVGEHGVEILHALAGTAVKIVLQSFLDGAHVHWLFNDVIVILNEIRERVKIQACLDSLRVAKDIKYHALL